MVPIPAYFGVRLASTQRSYGAARSIAARWVGEGVPAPSSAVSVASLGLKTSSRLLLAILKMNGIVMGNLGTEIPREGKELVNEHIWKQYSSPRLGGDEKLRIIETDTEESGQGRIHRVEYHKDSSLLPRRFPYCRRMQYPLVY